MVKQNKNQMYWILGVILVGALLYQYSGLFSIYTQECLSPCPQGFRCVQYSSLDDAPQNFVSRIRQDGVGCVLDERFLSKYINETMATGDELNAPTFINDCEASGGLFVGLDGVVINDYNLSGSHTGGCWAGELDGNDNKRCTQAGGTVNAGDFDPLTCPSDCKIIFNDQEFYTDLPSCLKPKKCYAHVAEICQEVSCANNQQIFETMDECNDFYLCSSSDGIWDGKNGCICPENSIGFKEGFGCDYESNIKKTITFAQKYSLWMIIGLILIIGGLLYKKRK